jgi:MFS family permease
MVQAIGAGAWVFARELGELYALSVVFGIAYGGVMPLYAILARDFFGARILGTVFGAISALANLGMAFGPWAGGWVFDTQGSYAWLFIGSFAVGLAGVAVALAFKPRPAVAQLALAE